MAVKENLALKRAFEIPCGNAVIIETEDEAVVCMKVERAGKEYTHHYVVPLHPVTPETATLLYVDPEEEMVDCAVALAFDVTDEDADLKPDVGHVLANHNGTFLKVREDPHSQKVVTYVNLETGAIHRRQEKKMDVVYRQWSATSHGNKVTLTTLCEWHEDLRGDGERRLINRLSSQLSMG